MSAKSPQIRIPQSLPPRQRQILELIADGRETKSIALELGISPKTVEFHRLNLMHRTDLFTYQHLTKFALRLGLTEIDV